jgi:hypothetical protein
MKDSQIGDQIVYSEVFPDAEGKQNWSLSRHCRVSPPILYVIHEAAVTLFLLQAVEMKQKSHKLQS